MKHIIWLDQDMPEIPPELPPQLRALLLALAVRHRGTYHHCRQVSYLVDRLADWIGIPEEEGGTAVVAGLLHDVGKLGVPEAVLLKPTRLSDRETREISLHSDIGAAMLLRVGTDAEVISAVHHHHEFFDGHGYPRGLKGTEIPLGARMIAVADAFDSMTSPRTYRPSLSTETALAEIARCSGTQFDPNITEAFLAMIREAMAQEQQWASRPGADPGVATQPLALRLGAIKRPRGVDGHVALQTG